MHVVMLSDLETVGGAAISASRLADSLVLQGHRVTRIVHEMDGREHQWRTIELRAHLSVPVRAAARLFGAAFRKSFARTENVRQLTALLQQFRPDVINLHNLHAAGEWSLDLVSCCERYAPVVWTLHDMWSFTGRCAYTYNCRAFLTGCNAACPTPEEYPSLAPELIEGAWERRRILFQKSSRLVAVCPSQWLAGEAASGFWAAHRVEVIPNGVDHTTYESLDRKLARESLGLPAEGTVLLTAAQVLAERRKGGDLLAGALQLMRNKPVTLVTLGSDPAYPEIPGVRLHHLGYVEQERTLALAYCAADLLVHPAPVDNLPNTVLESIACGTPVVAFRTGGVPEMVRPGATGWLAEDLRPEGLAQALDEAIAQVKGNDLRQSCRRISEEEYSLALQAQRYAALFSELQSVRGD